MTLGDLNDLERSVLKQLVSGEHSALAPLQAQLLGLKVRSREFTDYGFFTELQVAEGVPPAGVIRGPQWIDGVGATIKGLEYGASFMVHVEDGFLDLLEGFAYIASWPNPVEEYSVHPPTGARGLPTLFDERGRSYPTTGEG